MIEIGNNYVTISDSEGNVIVHWNEEEWHEDPSVTLSIANAIHIFHTQGQDYLKNIINEV